MKTLTKKQTRWFQYLLDWMGQVERLECDSDARDGYEAVRTELAAYLVLFGFRGRPTADLPQAKEGT